MLLLIILLLFILSKRIFFRKDSPSGHSPPNVVIVVMDTARQDHLSCYGYKRNTTPNLNKLVEDSRIYYNAYSTSCWTSSAHASLFTGLFTITHRTSQENWSMNDQLTTLAEVFKTEGYETTGITENPMLARNHLFDQGFLTYHETWKMDPENRISTLFGKENMAFDLFKKSLKRRNQEMPFFIFINFIEPHSPYNSSEQFYDQFLSDPNLQCVSNRWQDYYLGRIGFDQNELRHLNELYDAEIRYVDHYVGKIMRELKKRKLWENTVFIVTSDHGENIGDHGMMDHVFSLYESTIKIPLIIHYPKLIPGHSEEHDPVELTDIFPTVLKISGISLEKYPSQGHDLFETDHGGENPVFCEYYYPEQALRCFKKQDRENIHIEKYKRRIRCIISNHMKLIWGSDGNHELYDLMKDPEESENLFYKETHRMAGREMMKTLENILNDLDQDQDDYLDTPLNQPIDEQTLDALRSLGYIYKGNE